MKDGRGVAQLARPRSGGGEELSCVLRDGDEREGRGKERKTRGEVHKRGWWGLEGGEASEANSLQVSQRTPQRNTAHTRTPHLPLAGLGVHSQPAVMGASGTGGNGFGDTLVQSSPRHLELVRTPYVESVNSSTPQTLILIH